MPLDQAQRDATLTQYYREGKTRKEAMAATGIRNTNSMSSVSGRLSLHWSWPLENRLSGQKPEGSSSSSKKQPGPKGGNTKSRRRRAFDQNKLEGERLKALDGEPSTAEDPLAEVPEISPDRTNYRQYGAPTHLSSAQRRKRGLVDNDEGGAFEGISPDIVSAFAQFYVNPD